MLYVEYREPGRGWVRVAEWADDYEDDAVEQFRTTLANVSAITEVRLVSPGEVS